MGESGPISLPRQGREDGVLLVALRQERPIGLCRSKASAIGLPLGNAVEESAQCPHDPARIARRKGQTLLERLPSHLEGIGDIGQPARRVRMIGQSLDVGQQLLRPGAQTILAPGREHE